MNITLCRARLLHSTVQVEQAHPGFTYDLVMRLVNKADLSVNMNESILRLQGGVSTALYCTGLYGDGPGERPGQSGVPQLQDRGTVPGAQQEKRQPEADPV